MLFTRRLGINCGSRNFALVSHPHKSILDLNMTDFDEDGEIEPGEYQLTDGKGVKVYNRQGGFKGMLKEGPQDVTVVGADGDWVEISYPMRGFIELEGFMANDNDEEEQEKDWGEKHTTSRSGSGEKKQFGKSCPNTSKTRNH